MNNKIVYHNRRETETKVASYPMWLSDRLDFHTLRSSTLSLTKINPNSFRTGVSAKHPSLLFTCLLLFILTLPEGILPAVSKHRFQITNENSLLARKPRANELNYQPLGKRHQPLTQYLEIVNKYLVER